MSRQEKNSDVQWFIEPLDQESNEQIMEFLTAISRGSADIEHVMIPDSEAKLHNVLEVSYDAMRYIVKSRSKLRQLRFKTWNRSRPRAPLRDCLFLFERKSSRQSAEAQRVERDLAKIKNPPVPTDSEDFEPF